MHVTYSYRHHCLVGLAIGDVEGHEEWHLPTYDPRNENKYHYKLHSLDIYFWTQDDALAFVNGVRRVLPPSQVDIQDEPAPPPPQQQQQEVSSVVQRLENVAIADSALPPPPPPPQTNAASNGGIPSFAPPPLSAVSAGPEADSPDSTTSPTSFAPIPYNPAAPAAPEQIRHREKTPPPEDGELNPLHQRLAQDADTPFSPGLVNGMPTHSLGPLSPGFPPPNFTHPPGAPSFPGPPVGTPGFAPQGFGYPHAHAHAAHPALQRAATMPAAPGMPAPALQSPYGAQPFPQSPAPPYSAQHHHHQVTPPIASPGLASPPPPPPMGGYSGYNYTTQQGGGHTADSEYAIHQQAYRPTEGETVSKYVPKKEVRGRLEDNAGRVERGVTGMLKKFERKFG